MAPALPVRGKNPAAKPRSNPAPDEPDSPIKMRRKKKKLPHEVENPQGEISPCKPAAFLGFFKPALAKRAGEEPNPHGEITMTNPEAFLGFFKPPRWIRKCPATRDEVYSPLPPPDPDKVPRLKKKKWKRRPRGYRVRRGWFCEHAGLSPRKGRGDNFMNFTPQEQEMLKEAAERRRRRAEAKYNKMYRSYISGLENRQGHIMRLMSDLVNLADRKHHEKHSLLYEQWRVQVYEYIQRQIEDSLEEISPDYIKDKLRWFHYQYMAIANKQMVMRDYPRPDYDPFEPLKHTIKFSVKELCDPVKHDLTKENTEKRFMGDPVADQAVTKETLDLKYWPAYQFRASKWGHIQADEEDGSEIVISQPDTLYSHDVLYNQVFVGDEYVKAELPRGKYMVPNKGMLPENHVEKPHGKCQVWDAEFRKQPKLRLWYN
ncbi:hypothetical protein SELMODRAFT_416350 [Selaginella moellendorffii]|uniref:Uncharacterized protein n=1 Tax=Selaginella moellendorffii TaxID=88036 RepID=D8RZ07_SELML|nr:hypothetical protein SELMODRAFT_416350 [Selaginella moellendorffii]